MSCCSFPLPSLGKKDKNPKKNISRQNRNANLPVVQQPSNNPEISPREKQNKNKRRGNSSKVDQSKNNLEADASKNAHRPLQDSNVQSNTPIIHKTPLPKQQHANNAPLSKYDTDNSNRAGPSTEILASYHSTQQYGSKSTHSQDSVMQRKPFHETGQNFSTKGKGTEKLWTTSISSQSKLPLNHPKAQGFQNPSTNQSVTRGPPYSFPHSNTRNNDDGIPKAEFINTRVIGEDHNQPIIKEHSLEKHKEQSHPQASVTMSAPILDNRNDFLLETSFGNGIHTKQITPRSNKDSITDVNLMAVETPIRNISRNIDEIKTNLNDLKHQFAKEHLKETISQCQAEIGVKCESQRSYINTVYSRNQDKPVKEHCEPQEMSHTSQNYKDFTKNNDVEKNAAKEKCRKWTYNKTNLGVNDSHMLKDQNTQLNPDHTVEITQRNFNTHGKLDDTIFPDNKRNSPYGTDDTSFNKPELKPNVILKNESHTGQSVKTQPVLPHRNDTASTTDLYDNVSAQIPLPHKEENRQVTKYSNVQQNEENNAMRSSKIFNTSTNSCTEQHKQDNISLTYKSHLIPQSTQEHNIKLLETKIKRDKGNSGVQDDSVPLGNNFNSNSLPPFTQKPPVLQNKRNAPNAETSIAKNSLIIENDKRAHQSLTEEMYVEETHKDKILANDNTLEIKKPIQDVLEDQKSTISAVILDNEISNNSVKQKDITKLTKTPRYNMNEVVLKPEIKETPFVEDNHQKDNKENEMNKTISTDADIFTKTTGGADPSSEENILLSENIINNSFHKGLSNQKDPSDQTSNFQPNSDSTDQFTCKETPSESIAYKQSPKYLNFQTSSPNNDVILSSSIPSQISLVEDHDKDDMLNGTVANSDYAGQSKISTHTFPDQKYNQNDMSLTFNSHLTQQSTQKYIDKQLTINIDRDEENLKKEEGSVSLGNNFYSSSSPGLTREPSVFENQEQKISGANESDVADFQYNTTKNNVLRFGSSENIDLSHDPRTEASTDEKCADIEADKYGFQSLTGENVQYIEEKDKEISLANKGTFENNEQNESLLESKKSTTSVVILDNKISINSKNHTDITNLTNTLQGDMNKGILQPESIETPFVEDQDSKDENNKKIIINTSEYLNYACTSKTENASLLENKSFEKFNVEVPAETMRYGKILNYQDSLAHAPNNDANRSNENLEDNSVEDYDYKDDKKDEMNRTTANTDIENFTNTLVVDQSKEKNTLWSENSLNNSLLTFKGFADNDIFSESMPYNQVSNCHLDASNDEKNKEFNKDILEPNIETFSKTLDYTDQFKADVSSSEEHGNRFYDSLKEFKDSSHNETSPESILFLHKKEHSGRDRKDTDNGEINNAYSLSQSEGLIYEENPNTHIPNFKKLTTPGFLLKLELGNANQNESEDNLEQRQKLEIKDNAFSGTSKNDGGEGYCKPKVNNAQQKTTAVIFGKSKFSEKGTHEEVSLEGSQGVKQDDVENTQIKDNSLDKLNKSIEANEQNNYTSYNAPLGVDEINLVPKDLEDRKPQFNTTNQIGDIKSNTSFVTSQFESSNDNQLVTLYQNKRILEAQANNEKSLDGIPMKQTKLGTNTTVENQIKKYADVTKNVELPICEDKEVQEVESKQNEALSSCSSINKSKVEQDLTNINQQQEAKLEWEQHEPKNEDNIDQEVRRRVVQKLKQIRQAAEPFEEEINNFTELEDSNKYYYIEESLRRLIFKLDDMFDDIGENKGLRDERKKVYRYIFPLFDKLDDQVEKNRQIMKM